MHVTGNLVLKRAEFLFNVDVELLNVVVGDGVAVGEHLPHRAVLQWTVGYHRRIQVWYEIHITPRHDKLINNNLFINHMK